MYKTIILPVVLYRCEIWSLILREEHRLRLFENRLLRRLLGLKMDEIIEAGENCTARRFITCTLNKI
jgi:hypothetical protein